MARKNPNARLLLWISFAIELVDTMGIGILVPIIPLLFTDPAYPYHLHITADLGYLLLGGLTALYPFAMFIAMPILGQVSDTFGRRPILIFSLIGTSFAYALFGLGIMLRIVPLLFLARALDGLTGGNVVVAQAAIADITTDKERIQYFGIIGAANGIGFILGPVIGALLSDPGIVSWFSAPTPFWFAAALGLLTTLAVLFFFPETHRTRSKKRIRVWQSFDNIKDAAAGKERRPLYVTSFLYQSGFAFIVTFFGVYLVHRFAFGQRDIGYLFAFVGILIAFTQIAITGPLAKRVRPQVTIPAALGVMSAALFGIHFIYSVPLLYALTIPASVSAGLALTNLTALISTTSEDRQQGSVLGVNSSVQSLAQAIPPLFAGAVAAIFAPATPVLFAALSIGAAAIFFVVTRPAHAAR